MSLKELQEIRKRYKQFYTKPFNPPVPQISIQQLYSVPTNANFGIRLLKTQIEQFRRLNSDFFAWTFNLMDELTAFLNATIENGVPAKCFTEDFDHFIKGEHKKWRLTPLQKGTEQLANWLKSLNIKSYIDTNESKLRRMCRDFSALADEKREWCPITQLDTELLIYFEAKNMNNFVTDVSRMVTSGDANAFDAKLSWLAKKLEIEKPAEIIVLKSSLLRCVFGELYVENPRVLMESDDIETFLEKCSYIASFSPRQLGLNLNLFNHEAADTPMRAIVRENADFRMISQSLSSMQFMTCLPEVFLTLEDILMKFDSLAQAADLKRKLGRFARMVEGEHIKKKMMFMSFDDYFSLFFAVLAVDPPINAMALAKWIDSVPSLSNAAMVNYVKATFIGAVDHIMRFGQHNLKITEQSGDDDMDPLGIACN